MATAERSRPPALTIREIHARAVRVPMRRPLGTSGGTIAYAPLVLVDLETAEGVPGRAYVFAYSDLGARALPPLIAGIAEMVRGDAVAPVAVAKKLDVNTVITFSGCPPGDEKGGQPNWIVSPWPPEFSDMLAWQWKERVTPYWKDTAKTCKAERTQDPDAFKAKYGTNKNKSNAFGKCVSQHAKTQEKQDGTQS